MINSRIIGAGHYLPKKVLTNDDLSKIVDTTNEWIITRTGIERRYIAKENELTSDLAYAASIKALKNADLKSSSLDYIIVATTTPDETFPSTASKIQYKLDASFSPAFDVQAVCSGFLYSMQLADSLIKSGKARRILVVGAETLSRIVDWDDRRTCVLFGDGAGAVILGADKIKKGIMASNLYSDGSFHDSLFADGGPSVNQKVGKIRMKGTDIFKQAVNKLSDATLKSLTDVNLKIEDIDWLIPHQANLRIINGTAKKLKVKQSKVISTVSEHANTSAASIPLALSTSLEMGKVKEDDIVAMCAIGGGLTWGSCILKI